MFSCLNNGRVDRFPRARVEALFWKNRAERDEREQGFQQLLREESDDDEGETEEKQVTAETAFYKFLGYGGVSSEFLSDHGFPQLELRLPIGIQQRQNDFLTSLDFW